MESQLGADAVGAGKTTAGHGVEALAGEAGIAQAVGAADAGAVEGHRQQARQDRFEAADQAVTLLLQREALASQAIPA